MKPRRSPTSADGNWTWQKNTLYWTEETYRIHETSPSEYTPTVETAIRFYAPESVPVISSAVKDAIERGRNFPWNCS